MNRPDVVIPVFRPNKRFDQVLQMLFTQTVRPARLILMNTEAEDFSLKDLRKRVECIAVETDSAMRDPMEVKLVSVRKEDFNHGGTRNLAVTRYSDAELFLMMTQDAVPTDIFLIERLLRSFRDPEVGAAYARQVAGDHASFSEQYLRLHNYGAVGYRKSMADVERLGIKAFMISNACAMYRRSEFDAIGGFVTDTIFGEDLIYGASLLSIGSAIAYVSEAKVNHTHNYGLSEQFRRSFDMAVSQRDYRKVFQGVSAERTGISFVKGGAEFCLSQRRYGDLFCFLLESAARYCGFFLGKHYRALPYGVVKACTLQPTYFEGRRRSLREQEACEDGMDDSASNESEDTPDLTELHALLRSALSEFIRFCDEKHLRYYAIGGTLLGAVRHGGFIPWDDDIDLAMPRQDYDRMIELCKNGEGAFSPDFRIECWQTDRDFKSYFAKVSSTKYELREKLLNDTTTRKGYLIDILPIDGTPESEVEREVYFSRAMWYRFLCGTANANTGIRTSRPKWEQLVLRVVLALKLYRFLHVKKVYESMDRLFHAQDSEHAPFVGTLTGAYKTREIVRRCYFGDTYDEFASFEFEGLKLRCPTMTEDYLRDIFGDYMELPPKEARKTHYQPMLRRMEPHESLAREDS